MQDLGTRCRREDVEVIVVGGGIAGLTAAWALQKRGRRVLVLEAGAMVGGRMRTDGVDGCIVDAGAQFLSTGYRCIPGLADEFGLSIDTCPTQASAIRHDARWRVVRNGRPWDALFTGLLGPRSWMALGGLHWRYREALQQRDLSDLDAWADFDDESTDAWMARVGDRFAVERVIEPMLEGLYFQQPQTTSKALALTVLAYGWRRHQVTALRGGMARLPEAIAGRVPVRVGARVLGLVPDVDGVTVTTSDVSYRARQVVCAVPAPDAAALWPSAPSPERGLMATPYSATINIALVLAADYRVPAPLHKVYGALVPHRERQRVAALALENGKHSDRAPSAVLANVMLSDAAAIECLTASDDAVMSRLREEIDGLLPGAFDAVRSSAIFRWPCAEPRSPVGRARAIARYRESRMQAGRIVLAGDYLGAPTTDGAAASGQWAAAQLSGE